MKTVIVVQARMTSERLPGKVLKTVLGKPLLEYQIERMRRIRLADAIIIATTVNRTDDPVTDLCDRLDIPYFRDSEHDVLSRYYHTALAAGADTVVRLTADCPLIDPVLVDDVIREYKDNFPKYDYVCNNQLRSYPRGLDAEVFSMDSLSKAFRNASHEAEREHVTPYMYNTKGRFNIKTLVCEPNHGKHRWTVDTIEDFELIEKIISALYPSNSEFSWEDVLDLIERNPELALINAHIQQK